MFSLGRRRTNASPNTISLIRDKNRVIVAIIDPTEHLYRPTVHRDLGAVEAMRSTQNGVRSDDCPAAYPVAHGESYSACMGMFYRMRTPCEHKKRCKKEDADMHVSSPSCTT